MEYLIETANDRPYLWALYAVVLVLPFVFCAACCVRSKVGQLVVMMMIIIIIIIIIIINNNKLLYIILNNFSYLLYVAIMLHGVVFHDGIRTPFLPLRALLCLCKCSVIAFTCRTRVLHVLCMCFD